MQSWRTTAHYWLLFIYDVSILLHFVSLFLFTTFGSHIGSTCRNSFIKYSKHATTILTANKKLIHHIHPLCRIEKSFRVHRTSNDEPQKEQRKTGKKNNRDACDGSNQTKRGKNQHLLLCKDVHRVEEDVKRTRQQEKQTFSPPLLLYMLSSVFLLHQKVVRWTGNRAIHSAIANSPLNTLNTYHYLCNMTLIVCWHRLWFIDVVVVRWLWVKWIQRENAFATFSSRLFVASTEKREPKAA